MLNNFNQLMCWSLFDGLKDALSDFNNMIITVAVIIAIALIIIACVRYENGRWFLMSFFGIVFIGFTIFAGVQLGFYYSAKGGIVGYLSGIFQPNQIEIKDSKFSLKDIMLTKQSDGTYRAEFESSEVFELKENTYYGLFVNGAPCDYLQYASLGMGSSKDNINATYSYVFLGENGSEICDDTLTIQVAFSKASTKFILKTGVIGSDETIKIDMWNSYFNKNNFTLEIKQIDKIYMSGGTKTVTFKVDNSIYGTIKVPSGYDCYLPEYEPGEDYKFDGWYLGSEKVTKIENLKTDITLVAKLIPYYKVSFSLNNPDVDNNSNVYLVQKVLSGDSVTFPSENPVRDKYTFLGWSTDKQTIIDSYIINDNVTLYAIWSAVDFPVTLELGLAESFEINNQVYNSNTNLNYKYDEKIVIDKLNLLEKYSFDYYLIKNNEDRLIVNDINFNLSASEIYQKMYSSQLDEVGFDIEFNTITIVPVLTHNDSIFNLSDYDLKKQIQKSVSGNSESVENISNEQFINTLALRSGIDSNLSLFEKEDALINKQKQLIIDTANLTDFELDFMFTFNYDETLTTRGFLEIFYELSLKYDIHKVYKYFPISFKENGNYFCSGYEYSTEPEGLYFWDNFNKQFINIDKKGRCWSAMCYGDINQGKLEFKGLNCLVEDVNTGELTYDYVGYYYDINIINNDDGSCKLEITKVAKEPSSQPN